VGARRVRGNRSFLSAFCATAAEEAFRRVFFAGEHTSAKWQGYMNGAIASGYRTAEEMSLKFLG
jgi:monoamine oxidase